jgi:hypothetical protein
MNLKRRENPGPKTTYGTETPHEEEKQLTEPTPDGTYGGKRKPKKKTKKTKKKTKRTTRRRNRKSNK